MPERRNAQRDIDSVRADLREFETRLNNMTLRIDSIHETYAQLHAAAIGNLMNRLAAVEAKLAALAVDGDDSSTEERP